MVTARTSVLALAAGVQLTLCPALVTPADAGGRKADYDVCWQNLGDAGFPDRTTPSNPMSPRHIASAASSS